MSWRVGVDIGGTFTDVAMVEEATGKIAIAKVPTTNFDFSQGVLAGLKAGLRAADITASDVALLSHATTMVTNALLEHRGARTAFISTRGFRDILELRRATRVDLYNLFQDSPPVLVPRSHRYEITERIDAQGRVVTSLDEAEVAPLIAALRQSGVQTVAVSLLFSFLNNRHEKRLAELLRAGLPGVQIFLSSDVLPEIREFERASTTTVCAYVGPLLESYLDQLQAATNALGFPALHVMGSSGGMVDIAECLRMPAQVVESGPAAGVIAAALAGTQMNEGKIITFDMGGTTAKASIIIDGEITVTPEYEVGGAANAKRWSQGSGHPIRTPVVDLAEVSSGGGSIAWIDPGGALKVGPKSAGAIPGPAAYGRGGLMPTVTDANVVLGHLNPDYLLDGELKIDVDAALTAINREIAEPLGISAVEAAARIIAVVNANMCAAINIVSVERGHDPKEFTMVAFGGAGPIHAMSLASELDIPRVIIPPVPGTFSALGLIAADFKREYSRTLYAPLKDIDLDRLAQALSDMAADAERMFAAAKVPAERRRVQRFADVRYRRQAYELIVPIDDGPITADTPAMVAEAFHRKHQQTYGHASTHDAVQVVNVRLTAVATLPKLELARPPDPARARNGRRDVWFPECGMVSAPILWREGLTPGMRVEGPAVLESLDSTTVLPPGWSASVNARGFFVADRI